MTWKIRHEGSPRSIEGLTLEQVVEGLQDGLWEPTDEVMGSAETSWTAIESHPRLTDVALDMQPPPRKHYDDETRLDMNALIDVTLVLLIFFILTTSYAALQRLLEEPSISAEKVRGPVKSTEKEVKELTIAVAIHLKEGQVVF